ncbi:hypothetical protein LCGC14_1372760 [marine sediment metagenome]|uniref:Uncharacterized protein n=1 Tax=marine sediment metagenome TaxID=412755 RepID=A0A0F9KQZ4_9ZZZZ|nr:hypothetical protein [Methylophaga sp.]HEC58511.1 hypothetical protein [Methylophaga sp.]
MTIQSEIPTPTEQEMAAAKRPHDIFLSNLIMNHILLFTGISTFGPQYIYFMALVPFFSICAIAYTYYRSTHIKREDSEFVYVHWQVARRWSRLFAGVLLLLASVSLIAFSANHYLGLMKEAVYGLIGGFGLLPTLITVLVLIVIESDSLQHARTGTIPKWALKKFYGIES